ncbi:cytochrome b [Pseudoalteromonas rhizosphaerae]|uniref:cytochrome b n=1 Tax=Pseudoalteromonas rhizosphaerae TaxID=2518973 RepID=UPI001230FE65|nr:cytochrome b/b6 domain-containing protein [Pseudoalteromonas rhizosphaerae]
MKYPFSIRIFHWVSAALILGLLILGIYMTPYDESNMPFADGLYFWHKSFGVLMFLIVIFRFYNRKKHTLPELPSTLPKHEKFAAHVVHKGLYLLMIIIPLIGYIQSSSYEYSGGVPFFIMYLPEIITKDATVFAVSNFLHRWLSYLFILLLTCHILGALKHRFFDKENDVLNRII